MRFCGVPDRVEALGGRLSRWRPGSVVKWGIIKPVAGFSFDDFKDVHDEIWASWTDLVSDVRMEFVRDYQKANIRITTEWLGGPDGTLADCGVPPPDADPDRVAFKMRYDAGDVWVVGENPPPKKKDLVRTGKHEGGHGLGLFHNEDGVKNALMDPHYSDIRTQQPWDIGSIQKLYGIAGTKPPPDSGTCDEKDWRKLMARAFAMMIQEYLAKRKTGQ